MKLADLKDLHKEQAEESINTFYISFSDLMVLLCVFFVMLLGVSKVSRGSFEQLSSGFSGKTTGTLVELADDLQSIAQGIRGINVRMTPEGVRLDLDSAALFRPASSIIKENSLNKVVPLIQRIKNSKYTVDVEGHSDDQPYTSTRKTKYGVERDSNWSLSGRRASSVVQFLASFGVPDDRLRVIGYASNKPLVEPYGSYGDDLKIIRQQNRRVSLLVH